MAETNPLSRQPTSLDYLSPTQFAFNILQLPKVQFNTVSVNIPDISLGESVIPTPFKDIPIQGTSLTYGNLDITFIVDEELDNYREIRRMEREKEEAKRKLLKLAPQEAKEFKRAER